MRSLRRNRKERPLDVDHILPRSRGGGNDKSSLLVLCSRCNRAKGNRDTRNFKSVPPALDLTCLYCSDEMTEWAVEASSCPSQSEDAFPVTDGHIVVIPNRHTQEFFSITTAERQEANDLLWVLRERIRSHDPEVGGFNISKKCSQVAGQTVFHAHIHPDSSTCR